MANTAIQELQIRNNSANNLLAELSREERQKKLREHESARDRVPEGRLDPPEEVSDEMIQDALQRDDVKNERYLRNPENIKNIMQVVQGGLKTYKALQQFPIEVIKTLLLRGLGQKALAQNPTNDLKIGNQNLASLPYQDGRLPTRPFVNRPYENPELFIKTPKDIKDSWRRMGGLTGIPFVKRKQQNNVA